jgi:O-acetylserine/cysteine efflux transporter
MSFSTRHYALLIFIIFLWAANFIAIKFAVNEIPPVTAATLRYLFTSLVFLPFIKWPGREQFWIIAQISAFMYILHQGSLFVAVGILNAGSASVLLQTQVIFATILGFIFFKEKIGWKTCAGIAVSLSGVAIMLGSPDIIAKPWGSIISIGSAMAVAASYVKMKQLKTVHPATYISLTAMVAFPFLFVTSLVLEPGSWQALPDANWNVLIPILIFQVFILSLTHMWYQRLIHLGDVGRLSSFSLLIPVFAVALSVLILGEELNIYMVCGGLLTMLGVAIITLRRIQKGIPQ